MTFNWWASLIGIGLWLGSNATDTSQPCVPLNVVNESIVCVCNCTYCDTIGIVDRLDDNSKYLAFTSSKDGLRFDRQLKAFVPNIDGNETLLITLDSEQTFQTIMGFGGSFTDAVGLNILTLSPAAQDQLLKSYFGTSGIEYSIGRIPIGGCDFSTRAYSYDDDHDGDFNLTYWSLQPEDYDFKIPIIQRAINFSSLPVSLLASAWSAPTWMKTSGTFDSNGTLKGEVGGPYYQTWADYHIKFLDAYKAQGLNMWGLTAQNEPNDGLVPGFPFNCMGFTSHMQRDFIKLNLGPTLESSGYGDLKLMMFDDQRYSLLSWTEEVLSDNEAAQYISGIAVHWYGDLVSSPDVLNTTHHRFPEKFLLATEACEGFLPLGTQVKLGSWDRAESYAHDILEDLANWFIGWVDWNMCLDQIGGPNWVANFVDSPIIVNAESDEFYKQPMYYAMGHFSKFVKPGSVRIVSTIAGELPKQVEAIAFDGPDSSTIVILLNRSNNPVRISISDIRVTGVINEEIAAHAIVTLIWWR